MTWLLTGLCLAAGGLTVGWRWRYRRSQPQTRLEALRRIVEG